MATTMELPGVGVEANEQEKDVTFDELDELVADWTRVAATMSPHYSLKILLVPLSN
jgi:hypothetical protein